MTDTNTGNGRTAGHTGNAATPLAGCAAVVTGASSGIGAATALALAREGADVALVARRADRLEELAAGIRDEGRSCIALTADLRDMARARQAIDDAVERFARLDVMVNSVGYAAVGPFEFSDPEDWERMVDLNVRAVLHTSQKALPHLLAAAADGPRGVADLVNISSTAGRLARPENSVYCATKHAVTAFSESLRQEVTGRGVRVGVVEPGMTRTEMTAAGGVAAVAHGMPRESWLHAADIARCITFMVTQPPHAAINELMVRPTAQER